MNVGVSMVFVLLGVGKFVIWIWLGLMLVMMV